ncbi:hypothetical protein AKJ57_01330 [candidate division MSBL1 archaeon SCGC-AAA259A05]|uniref:HTH luxR-type domain-containing protein n=1 Tax=candidate division MSBL1 archaeon SCGC-AAA259A05 TaxID=1698259 RepID=A0A133UB67_9EURY|nr:hypothetical protein AKJ57_01330 [candidate division MSBL1 archaeon SCGC-AAA259A05]
MIEKFADLLEKAGIPYMVFGAYAVILRIPHRNTFDGDFVVERVDAENVKKFIDLVHESNIFDLDERAARDSLSGGGKFSVFSKRYGIHVFVWSKDVSKYREEESGLYVAIPELIIGEKLKLAKDGKADAEDKKDIVAFLTSSLVSLDEDKLREITDAYGVSDLLEKYRKRASSVKPGDVSGIENFSPPDVGATRVEQVARMWKNGKSYKEMANELGISQSTVGVYVGRARERGLIPKNERRK